MIKLLSKISELVKMIFQKKLYLQHCHLNRGDEIYYVYQSLLYLKIMDSSNIPANIANLVLGFIKSGGIDLRKDIDSCLQSLVRSCEVCYEIQESSGEIVFQLSNILFAFLSQFGHLANINAFDITKCLNILKFCSQDVVNLPVPRKTTLLHVAVGCGNELLIRFLIDIGAHPDAVDVNGIPPKEMAISKNSTIQWIFGPDHLSCIACRMIVKESLKFRIKN